MSTPKPATSSRRVPFTCFSGLLSIVRGVMSRAVYCPTSLAAIWSELSKHVRVNMTPVL